MTADDTSLDAAFDKSLQLAFPPVLVQLLKALLEPTPSFTVISRYLAMDPILAGAVLHLANSSSQGFNQKVTEIQRAAVVLGTEVLYKMMLSLTVQKQLRPLHPRDPAHLFADWRITLWGAAAAETLALKLCPAKRQAAYLAALLRDLPLLLAFCRQVVPDFLEQAGVVTLSSPQKFTEEEAAWGRSHAELAGDIMTIWGMPSDVAEAVRTHHACGQVAAAPPLSRVLMYATRWAEATQSPGADPGSTVAFELGMATELGLGREELEKLRTACAERFTPMLAQLGIKEGAVETRFYEHSLDVLQNLHFLALEVCSESTLRRMVETLGRKLLTFWGLNTWELTLAIPGWSVSLFTCRGGNIQPEEQVDPLAAHAESGREVIHLTASGRRFGRLCVPADYTRSGSPVSLPLFTHVLAMNLERIRRLRAEDGSARAYSVPANAALMDAGGKLTEAGNAFLSLFDLEALPESIAAKNFLAKRLGAPLPDWDMVLCGGLSERVWLVPARADGKRGPVFLSLRPLADRKGEFCLMAESLPALRPEQAVSLNCPDFFDILTTNLVEQVFLLDAVGGIFWACPPGRALVGKNIFSITRPKSTMQSNWAPMFLDGLSAPLTVDAQLSAKPDTPKTVRLCFSPLPGCENDCRLLTIRLMA